MMNRTYTLGSILLFLLTFVCQTSVSAQTPYTSAKKKFIEFDPSPATIILSDFNGKVYFTQQINCGEGENFYQLDATDVPNGLYLLQILRPERYEILKISVQH